jgi:hypothetical protein
MTQNSATVIVRMSPQQKTRLGVLAAGAGMSSWIRDRIDEAVRQDQAAIRLGANPPPTSENPPPHSAMEADDIDVRVAEALGWAAKYKQG